MAWAVTTNPPKKPIIGSTRTKTRKPAKQSASPMRICIRAAKTIWKNIVLTLHYWHVAQTCGRQTRGLRHHDPPEAPLEKLAARELIDDRFHAIRGDGE